MNLSKKAKVGLLFLGSLNARETTPDYYLQNLYLQF
jgi:hypothetical protein